METNKEHAAEEKNREIKLRFIARLIGFVLGVASGLALLAVTFHR